jgi:hypothetical protein
MPHKTPTDYATRLEASSKLVDKLSEKQQD